MKTFLLVATMMLSCKALFVLDLEAVFMPACVPPMSVEWSNVQLLVTAADGTVLIYP